MATDPEEPNYEQIENGEDGLAEGAKTRRLLWTYAILVLFNAIEFGLTSYSIHDILTDPGLPFKHKPLIFTLGICLAASCVAWVAIAYGLVKNFKREWLVPGPTHMPHEADVVMCNRASCTLWCMAALMHAFLTLNLLMMQSFDPREKTRKLTVEMAVIVVTLLNCVAWILPTLWVGWESRMGQQNSVGNGGGIRI